MVRTIGNRFHSWRWFSGLLAGIVAGYAAGIAAQSSSSLHAEVTELPRREAFQAGGERSELVLRDIAAILKRMDTRLDRIEHVVVGKGAAEAKKK
jgi:hypothetical protein